MNTTQKTTPVIVEKIYPARDGKNQNYKTLQLRQERDKPVSTGNLRNLMLSANASTKAQLVAFESMHKDAIEAFSVEEGSDFGSILGQEVTLKVTELTEEEYLALSTRERIGFQFKINNSDDQMILVKAGRPVFRKVSVDIAGAEDKTVSHDAMVESTEFDINDYREIVSTADADLQA